MLDPARQPVIVGVGHVTRLPADVDDCREPADLLTEAARNSLDDARIGAEMLDAVIGMPTLSWPYDDLAASVAQRLGATHARPHNAAAGGEVPVSAIAELASVITSGQPCTGVVVGGEAMLSRRRLRELGVRPPWAAAGHKPGPVDLGWASGPRRHGLSEPMPAYALAESAYRTRRGATVADERLRSAQIWSQMSRVASRTAGALTGRAVEAADIATPSPTNRMVAHPYTKLMCANPMVDQAAAVIVTSWERARTMGVPEDQVVHLWGDAAATDTLNYLRRPDFASSAPMASVLDDVLDQCRLDARALTFVELYSCFPIVPKLAIDALGRHDYDDCTVAGGLTFYGGPFNAYMLCAATAGVRRMRDVPDSTMLLYGNGKLLTNHHALVLATTPRADGYAADLRYDLRKRRLHARHVRDVAQEPAGSAVIDAATALHGRGDEARVVVIASDAEGARFAAHVPGATADDAGELVGRSGTARSIDGLTVLEL